ncbi:hypothetical protein PMAYCL1PPCAC_22257, partial [Pristionchus mayeri]
SAPPEAEWQLVKMAPNMFIHHWLTIVGSWFGYGLLGVIIYACNKKRVFWNRFHDVLLVLFFAFATDLPKMRMHIYFAFSDMQEYKHDFLVLPTTVAACTMGLWMFFSHFCIAYVHAIVTLYRFIGRFRRVSLTVLYIALGSVFAFQAAHIFESFLHGKAEALRPKDGPISTISCYRAYMIDDLLNISNMATAVATLVAPSSHF